MFRSIFFGDEEEFEEGVLDSEPCPTPAGIDVNVFIRVFFHVFCDGDFCTMHILL